jgi:hypothetical protein
VKYAPDACTAATSARSPPRPVVIESDCTAATPLNAPPNADSARNTGYDVDVMVNRPPSSDTNVNPTRTTRSASRMPGGAASMSRWTRPNIAAFVPMTSPNVSTTPATKAGSRRNVRAA